MQRSQTPPAPSYTPLLIEGDTSNESTDTIPANGGSKIWKQWTSKATHYHSKVPLVRKLPPRAVGIITLLILINALVWAAIGIVLHYHPRLTGPAVLAYTLGLRHALDADHISAIDLMTRRLVAANQRPVTVGTFFSLGHSTIVVVTSIVVAASAASLTARFDAFGRVGGIVGSAVSSAFLLLLGVANAYILWVLARQMRRFLGARRAQAACGDDGGGVRQGAEGDGLKLEGAGCLFRVLQRAFRFVDRPWKMYPLGVLFGLGFDTSSEVALLGIASIQATAGTSLWLILVFPVLFTAGMCLLDTVDGALMMSLYTSAQRARDPLAVLYYNIVLTCLTVMVAVVIGVLQVLGMVLAITGDGDGELKGRFWDGVRNAQDRYDVIGGAVCGAFVVVGGGSVLVYPHWRRWVDRGQTENVTGPVEEVEGGGLNTSTSEEQGGAASNNGSYQDVRKNAAVTAVEKRKREGAAGEGPSMR